MQNKIFVVLSHVEVSEDNFDTMVCKAFTKLADAELFAEELRSWADADSKETISVESVEFEA